MEQITRDVVIVGGSLSGAICAAYLAKAGVDVLLIENEDFPGASPQVEILREAAVAHINSIGAVDALDKMSACLRNMQLIGSNGEAALVPRECYTISRYKLTELLLESAEKLGTDIKKGCHVTDLIPSEEDAPPSVKLLRGTRESVIRAKVIIGADGIRSQIGRKAGLINPDDEQPWHGEWGFFSGVHLDEVLAKNQYEGYGIYAFSELINPGYMWIIPCGHRGALEGYCNVGFVTPRDDAPDLKEVIKSNEGAYTIMTGARLIDSTEAGIVMDSTIKRSRCSEGVILIGSGASTSSPLYKDRTLAEFDSAKAAAEAAMDALGNENYTKEFIEGAYEKGLHIPKGDGEKYGKLTLESMYDIDVINEIVKRMSKDQTYNKKCEKILKEAYL